MGQKLIIAHRGASKEAPENTLEAFSKAIGSGADMIETDIRKTKDNVLILHHDPDISGQAIAQLDYRQIKALSPQIPTLEEALRLIAGKIKLDAEIKEDGYGKEVAELILKYLPPKDFVITSSFKSVLREVKSSFPQIKTGWIIGNRRWVTLTNILSLVFGKFPPEADLLVLNWVFYYLGLRFFAKTFDIYVFTVDNLKVMSNLLKAPRNSGVISNDPRIAVKIRDALKE